MDEPTSARQLTRLHNSMIQRMFAHTPGYYGKCLSTLHAESAENPAPPRSYDKLESSFKKRREVGQQEDVCILRALPATESAELAVSRYAFLFSPARLYWEETQGRVTVARTVARTVGMKNQVGRRTRVEVRRRTRGWRARAEVARPMGVKVGRGVRLRASVERRVTVAKTLRVGDQVERRAMG